MNIIKLTLLCLSLFVSNFNYAQEKPNACQSDPGYSEFDFWLGHWKVYDANNQLQGENRITKTPDGCLIKEFWTSIAGNNGFSMNYYNPTTKIWTQNWVSAGSVIEYRGSLSNGSMILEGQIYYQNSGTNAPFRGTWTLLEDGRVRQHFEQFSTEKQQWSTWFEGFYVKQAKE